MQKSITTGYSANKLLSLSFITVRDGQSDGASASEGCWGSSGLNPLLKDLDECENRRDRKTDTPRAELMYNVITGEGR
jgi:hypothetical protein